MNFKLNELEKMGQSNEILTIGVEFEDEFSQFGVVWWHADESHELAQVVYRNLPIFVLVYDVKRFFDL